MSITPMSVSDATIESSIRAAYDKQTTIDNYLHRLQHLQSSIFPGKGLYWIIMGPSVKENYAKIREKYPNVNTRKNVLTAILAVLRHATGFQSDKDLYEDRRRLWMTFHDHMGRFQEARYKRNLPSDRQMSQYTPMEDIELMYNSILNKSSTHKTLQDSQQLVLLSLIVSTPPKRSDYGALRVYYEDDPNLDGENYIVLRARTPSFVALNKYKTSKRYARVDEDLPARTARDIKDSLRRWPRTYLFETRFGKPFATNDAYAKYVRGVFLRLFGRTTGVTMLRHIYITEKVDFENMNEDELEDVARQMLHSTTLQRKYNWSKRAICETLKKLCPECR